MSDDPAFAALIERLRQEAAALAADDAETAESRAPVELDQTSVGRLSRMDAMQQQAMAQAQSRRRKMQVARVAAALRRAERGEYGVCVGCGEDIDPQRLALDPATPQCIACASAASRS